RANVSFFLPWDRRVWRYKPHHTGDRPGCCHGVQAFMNELRSLRKALRRGPVIALALSVSFAAISPVAAQSLTDRFKGLFGGKSDEPAQSKPAPGQPAADDDVDCQQVTVRGGESTFAVGAIGRQAVGNDV